MKNYNIEHIDRLRIHELRDFARQVGVSSPTTLKKDELIMKITDVIRDSDSEENANKFTKHHKDFDFFTVLLSDDSRIIDDIITQEDDERKNNEDNEQQKSKTYVIKSSQNSSGNIDYSDIFRNELSAFTYKVSQNPLDYGDHIKYSVRGGYLQILPQGYGVLRGEGLLKDEDDIYISVSLIKKNKLKNGMYVYGKVRKFIEDKPAILYEIESVDDEYPTSDKSFEELPYNAITEDFYLDKHNMKIKRGERLYIRNADIASVAKLCEDLLLENGVRAKFINIKCRPEEQLKPDQKLQVINCMFNTSPEDVLKAVELTMERLKREMEYGSSTVLIIYNFSELVRIFNVAIQGYYDFSKMDVSAIGKVTNILSLAKFIEYKLNSTIICIDKNGIPADIKNIMELEIMPIFNTILDSID